MTNLPQNSQLWAVLLADIVDSRKLRERRAAVQQRALDLVDAVNRELPGRLRVPLALSGGDEVQGLLRRPADAAAVMDALDLGAEGFRWRFAVGWGAVTTAFRPTTFQMDGDCFRTARAALERARREKRWAAVGGFGKEADRVLDGVLAGTGVIRRDWTERQRQAIRVRRRHASLTAAAADLGVVPSTLSKMLKAAHARELAELEAALAALLDRFAASAGGGKGETG